MIQKKHTTKSLTKYEMASESASTLYRRWNDRNPVTASLGHDHSVKEEEELKAATSSLNASGI